MFLCENCGHLQDTTTFGECEQCSYEDLIKLDSTKSKWIKESYDVLDREGYIPQDWILHENGDIEHRDGDLLKKAFLSPFNQV